MMRYFNLASLPVGRTLASLTALLVLAGCAATVELAASDEDRAAKSFTPAEGMANIYVTRKEQFTGSAVLFQLVIDQTVVGGIAPGTYHLIPVAPGHHTISVTTAENQSVEEIEAEPGRSYFFEVKPKMGWMSARAEVQALSEAEGRTAVSENALAQGIDDIG